MQNQNYNLAAQKREIVGKKVRDLRKGGQIPAIVYGSKTDSVKITLPLINFKKVYTEAGTSALIDLTIDDQSPVKVLSHEPQYNPVTDEPIHVDFYQVRMDEEIKTEIPLEFVGESEAVETMDGSLVTNRDALEVECLPNALVSEIKVDLSRLKTFEDSITVGDLDIPSGIKVLTEAEEVIAVVEPPRSEEELAELETPTTAEEEKEAIEKVAGEEGAEGEAVEGEQAPAEGETEGSEQTKTEEKK